MKLYFLFFVIALFLNLPSIAETPDVGKEKIATLKTSLYLASNDPSIYNDSRSLKPKVQKKHPIIAKQQKKFNYSRLLGVDTKPVLRSYENWALPLKGSKALMLSFEAIGKPTNNTLIIDLNLWQKKKKIMKKAHTFEVGKPLQIQGPKYKKGYLILSIELVSINE